MEQIKWSAIIREHYDSIIDAMIELDAENAAYQKDLYLYPDGSTYEFDNIGGNSWLNDDHITVWSVDNQYTDWETEDADEIREICENNRERYEAILNAKIEWEEEREREYGRQSSDPYAW